VATSKHKTHSLRTLVILFAMIAALFSIMAVANVWAPKLGLDLRGGMQITLTATGDVSAENLAMAKKVIQQRVDSFGVGESEISTRGDRQIVVAMPNVNEQELVDRVSQTAELSFRKVYKTEAVSTTTTPPGLPQPVDSPRPTAAPSGASTTADSATMATLLEWTPSTQDTTDFTNYQCGDTFPDVSTEPLITCDQDKQNKYLLGPVLIRGTEVTRAVAEIPQNSVSWQISLGFSDTGRQQFGQVTTAISQLTSPENQFGIVLDGEVVSAPSVSEAITTGQASITSSTFTQKTATQLANVLSFGKLPVKFDKSKMSVENISPTLGSDQLRAGIIAGLIGLGLVIAYSILYYRGLSIVVTLSLAIAGALAWSMMTLLGQAIGFALSLPGIAGAIVAIGVTADSFIIYFERIRDEAREGRSLRTAIETGWVRSRKTIVAADSVSLLSSVVLFTLSTAAVQGFAFTLGLTTLIDLAVVFWFTKPLMTLLGRTKFYGGGHRLSGFDPEHMGTSSAPLHNSRRRSAATAGGKA
jgi:preprotein translocase subunit SecD